MQKDLRGKGELLTFLKKEQTQIQKELDSPISEKQKLLNLLSVRMQIQMFNTNVPVLRTFDIGPDDEEVMKNHHQC